MGSNDARYDFFIAPGRWPPKDHCVVNARAPKQLGFNFRWVHFFSCDINDVGNPTDNAQAMRSAAEQVVWNETAAAKFLLFRVREVAIRNRGAAHAHLTRHRFWINHGKIDTFHWCPDKTVFGNSAVAIITNPAAFRRSVKRMDGAPDFSLNLRAVAA